MTPITSFRIYKYPLPVITGFQIVRMPAGATIIHVAEQAGIICLWAEVFSDVPEEDRSIEIYGTGRDIDLANRRHLGSVVMSDGVFVWHVYERMTRNLS